MRLCERYHQFPTSCIKHTPWDPSLGEKLRLARMMAQRKFETRHLLLRPVAAVYAWSRGQPWERVLRIAEMEEGDLSMLILRTADNLRHIRNLKDVFPEAAAVAADSVENIMREPVAPY